MKPRKSKYTIDLFFNLLCSGSWKTMMIANMAINNPEEGCMKIKSVDVFDTPENMRALQDYLSQFSGGEAVVAQTCAWMAWNLAAKLTATESPEVS